MADGSTPCDLQAELLAANRRIRELEAALERRTAELEQKQAVITGIHESTLWRVATIVRKIVDMLLPPMTRRREWVKAIVRRGIRAVRWVQGRRTLPALEGDDLSPTIHFDTYQRWIRRFEPSRAELQRLRTHRFANRPKISIVVPVYHPPEAYLLALLRSVREQTYDHWELCLADGGGAESKARAICTQAAESDPRIRYICLMRNEGIVGNTNAAIRLATGDFIAFVDHDDELAPFALHRVVEVINAEPAADFLYSDEDKIDPRGYRVEPHFKPAWSPETLRARNYICHLTILRRELLATLGGLREGFEGAQDYDLVLRAGEQATKIVHIPHILYHWRQHPASTAADKASKGYAFEAGKRALEEHLQRTKSAGIVTPGPLQGTYRIAYTLPKSLPLVSVIIPNRDSADMLAGAVQAVVRSSYPNWEILIAENGSTQPETFDFYRTIETEHRARILKWTQPFNYAAINNFAVRQAKGELLLFLNNDIRLIRSDWLELMVRQVVQPGIGMVGAKLYYTDNTIQHAGIVLGIGGIAGHPHVHFKREAPGYMQRLLLPQNMAGVTAACLMMPRRVFDEVDGFDEGYELAFNDVDLCVKTTQAGYRIVWLPEVELYHLESKTRGIEDTPQKQARFRREVELFRSKWSAVLAKGDPYFGPNFRLDRTDFCLKT